MTQFKHRSLKYFKKIPKGINRIDINSEASKKANLNILSDKKIYFSSKNFYLAFFPF